MPHPSQRSPTRERCESSSESDSENNTIFDASTSPDELLKIARQFQIKNNSARSKVKRLHRKLRDITNSEENDDVPSPSHKRRKTACHNEPSDNDDISTMSDADAHTTSGQKSNEHFLEQAGHKFFLVYGPWLRSGDELFDHKIDNTYNTAERFENDKNKIQGQLREVLELLQERFEASALRQIWVRRLFSRALRTQRHNTATRLRHHVASVLGATDDDMAQPETRRTKFREEIGWVSASGFYSAVDVPLLHKEWHGRYSLTSVFLNPKLMGVYVAFIRGPAAAKAFMRGQTIRPQAPSMARIHNIRNITPGAIATASILARWALSGDDTLQQRGSSTGINYLGDYEEYLTILDIGLRQKKKSILNIFKQWDERLFPDSDSSIVNQHRAPTDKRDDLKRAMDLLAADSEQSEDEAAPRDSQGGGEDDAQPPAGEADESNEEAQETQGA